jgi:hypothetical protein
MQGCTFHPQVNPPPTNSSSPIPIALKNAVSYEQMKPVIDSLIKEELESTN